MAKHCKPTKIGTWFCLTKKVSAQGTDDFSSQTHMLAHFGILWGHVRAPWYSLSYHQTASVCELVPRCQSVQLSSSWEKQPFGAMSSKQNICCLFPNQLLNAKNVPSTNFHELGILHTHPVFTPIVDFRSMTMLPMLESANWNTVPTLFGHTVHSYSLRFPLFRGWVKRSKCFFCVSHIRVIS